MKQFNGIELGMECGIIFCNDSELVFPNRGLCQLHSGHVCLLFCWDDAVGVNRASAPPWAEPGAPGLPPLSDPSLQRGWSRCLAAAPSSDCCLWGTSHLLSYVSLRLMVMRKAAGNACSGHWAIPTTCEIKPLQGLSAAVQYLHPRTGKNQMPTLDVPLTPGLTHRPRAGFEYFLYILWMSAWGVCIPCVPAGQRSSSWAWFLPALSTLVDSEDTALLAMG